jgi:hypothetical protein
MAKNAVLVVACTAVLALSFVAAARSETNPPTAEIDLAAQELETIRAELASRNYEVRSKGWQRAMKHGEGALPLVMERLRRGTLVDAAFGYGYLVSLEEESLPAIDELITYPKTARIAIIAAEEIRPGHVASLPFATRRQASQALYRGAISRYREMFCWLHPNFFVRKYAEFAGVSRDGSAAGVILWHVNRTHFEVATQINCLHYLGSAAEVEFVLLLRSRSKLLREWACYAWVDRPLWSEAVGFAMADAIRAGID